MVCKNQNICFGRNNAKRCCWNVESQKIGSQRVGGVSMSNLAIQDLYQSKIDECVKMSTRELISGLKGSISSPKALSRDSMIDILAMKLSNDELRDGD